MARGLLSPGTFSRSIFVCFKKILYGCSVFLCKTGEQPYLPERRKNTSRGEHRAPKPEPKEVPGKCSLLSPALFRAGKSQQTIFLHYSPEPAEAQRDTNARWREQGRAEPKTQSLLAVSPFWASYTVPCWKKAEPSRQGQCLGTEDLTLTSNLSSGLQVRPST